MKCAANNGERGGFTLIEVSISVALLALILGGLGLALQVSFGLFRRTAMESDLNARCGRALERVVSEMRGTGLDSFAQDLTTPLGMPTVWSETLEFGRGADWVADAMVWGEGRRFTIQLADGELDNDVDDDGDGLVDERALVLIRRPGEIDEDRVVIASNLCEYLEGEVPDGVDNNGNGLVDERAFCVALADAGIEIRLSLQRATSTGEIVVQTQTDVLQLRN